MLLSPELMEKSNTRDLIFRPKDLINIYGENQRKHKVPHFSQAESFTFSEMIQLRKFVGAEETVRLKKLFTLAEAGKLEIKEKIENASMRGELFTKTETGELEYVYGKKNLIPLKKYIVKFNKEEVELEYPDVSIDVRTKEKLSQEEKIFLDWVQKNPEKVRKILKSHLNIFQDIKMIPPSIAAVAVELKIKFTSFII